jgi:hypothetical protein
MSAVGEPLFKWALSLTLVARGWLTWHWDSPIRGLVWQEDWWSGRIGLSWAEFAQHSDPWISLGLAVLGIGLMGLAIVPWLPRRGFRWMMWPAFLILLLDGVARWVGKDYDVGMAIEHILQMSLPLLWFFRGAPRWRFLTQVAVALTFIGHGLYAVGFHPVPLSYQTMTMGLLGCERETALVFLKVVGTLDFVAAVGMFIGPVRLASLGYMVLWGGATALARVMAHASVEAPRHGLDPWIAETLVRSSHWMVPLLLLLWWRSERNAGLERAEERELVG